jgi:hypothetical protein
MVNISLAAFTCTAPALSYCVDCIWPIRVRLGVTGIDAVPPTLIYLFFLSFLTAVVLRQTTRCSQSHVLYLIGPSLLGQCGLRFRGAGWSHVFTISLSRQCTAGPKVSPLRTAPPQTRRCCFRWSNLLLNTPTQTWAYTRRWTGPFLFVSPELMGPKKSS